MSTIHRVPLVTCLAMAAMAVLFGAAQPAGAQTPVLTEGYRLVDTWVARDPQAGVPRFINPVAVEVASDNTIYVVDSPDPKVSLEKRVYHLTDQGELIKSWVLGQLTGKAIAVTVSSDRVYVVSDLSTGEISSRDGQFIRSFTIQAAAKGIAVGPDRRIYVSRQVGVDTAFIDVLDVDGNRLESWPAATANGSTIPIESVYGIDVAPDGRVYMAGYGSVYSFVGGKLTAQMRVPPADEGPNTLDVTADNARVYAVQLGKLIVWDVSGAKASVVGTRNLTDAKSLDIGPGGGLVYVTNGVDGKGLSYFPDRANFKTVNPIKWGAVDTTLGRLEAPRRIGVGSTGGLFIYDTLDRVQHWSSTGRPVEQWTAFAAVDVAGGGPEPCSLKGEKLTCNGPLGSKPVRWEVAAPATGWWTATDGNAAQVAVVDLADQQLRLFDRADGKPSGGWALSADKGYTAISDVAMDATHVYLANRTADRIDVYQPDGTPTTPITLTGQAMRIDVADGQLFALTQDGWIWKLDVATGQPKAAWQPAQDGDAADIAAGPGGRLYVADNTKNRVLVYEPGGTPTTKLPAPTDDGTCNVNVAKSAAPASVFQGGTINVQLNVNGTCPLGDGRIDVMLVLDQSGSMTGSAIAEVQAAAIAFLAELNPTAAQVGVVGFSSSPSLLQPLSGDLRGVVRAVRQLAPGGQTIYTTALQMALDGLNGPTARKDVTRVVIMMTDGKPTDSNGLDEVVTKLKAANITFYTVGLGSGIDQDGDILLTQMASAPEFYFKAPSEADLADIYAAIAKRITSPRLLKTATVTDEIPADMDFVPNSAKPAVTSVKGRTLTWTLKDVPARGVTLRYDVTPRVVGKRPTNVKATLDYTDVVGGTGTKTFPVPQVTVLKRQKWTEFLPIIYRNRCRTLRADVILVLDTSSSMQDPSRAGSKVTKLQAAVAAARNFLFEMTFPGDQASIVSFNSVATVEAQLTGSRGALDFELANLTTGTGTRIDLGLERAYSELKSARRNKQNTPVVVLLTDGLPSGGSEAATLVSAGKVRTAGYQIYAIGLGMADIALLTKVSGSAARTFTAPDASVLTSIYSKIAGKALCN